jgi:hypothetical protein
MVAVDSLAFGILVGLLGLNVLFNRQWWAKTLFKSRGLFNPRFWEIDRFIFGGAVVIVGIVMVVRGILGKPLVF